MRWIDRDRENGQRKRKIEWRKREIDRDCERELTCVSIWCRPLLALQDGFLDLKGREGEGEWRDEREKERGREGWGGDRERDGR
jgi:hypothetical protein